MRSKTLMMTAVFALAAALPAAAVSFKPPTQTNKHSGAPGGFVRRNTTFHRGKIHRPDMGLSSVTIGTGTTANITCSGNAPVTCAPSGSGVAFLSASDLENYLAASNVVVTTNGNGGSQAADIIVGAPLSWSASTSLTLDADQSVTVNNPVVVNGSGAAAALSFITNDGGSGGLLSFGAGGYVNYADIKSSLSINGTTFTLLNSINSNNNTLNALVKAANRAFNRGLSANLALGASYDASDDKGGNGYSGSVVKNTFLKDKLEGLGNAITGLKVNKKAGGLFYSVSNSTVSDLLLLNINISGGGHKGGANVGGLANSAYQSSFSGDYVSGTINTTSGGSKNNIDCSGDAVGGLVGATTFGMIENSGSSVNIQYNSTSCGGAAGGLVESDGSPIVNSWATGNVTVTGYGGASAGGLVDVTGCCSGAPISHSFATGDVSVTGTLPNSAYPAIAGGLAGEANGGPIDHSFATGNVTTYAMSGGGAATWAGGLAGSAPVNITSSFAQGNVSATANNTTAHGDGNIFAGGLVGLNYENNNTIDYKYVYAMGSVSANGPEGGITLWDIGGLVGPFAFDSIDQAYSRGTVGASGGTNEFYDVIGGFLGEIDGDCGTITNSYWDMDGNDGLSGVGYAPGCSYQLNGETSSQLMWGLPAGFDPAVWTYDPNGIINGGFPYLIDNPPPQ